jgi:Caspase domain
VIPSIKTPSLRSFSAARLILAGCTVLLSSGCAWHPEVPSQGEPPSSTVKLESSPSIPTAVSLSKLRFKALLLDENGNLFLESGEQIWVRVDVVNTGSSPIQNASASLTGTPSVIEQFLSTRLTIPPLQPGETKSLEFAATLPSSLHPQQVEIRVSVIESGGAAARPQALLFIIQPVRAGADDMDQIPAPVSDVHQPQTYVVSIGAGVYRDTHIASRPYASRDADMVANYFLSLGGVPPSNIRLLHNQKALGADLHETLHGWLPQHAAQEAVVIVYFSGQAMVTPTGEILLALYDGSAADSARLYPLTDLASTFTRLKAKQTIFLFDGMVSRLHGEAKGKTASPRWNLGGGTTIGLIGSEDLTKGLEDDQHRHGLFTYYLLKGLQGEADTNRNGTITFGELAGYVRQKVAWAAKTQFNQEQRPLLLPPLKPDDQAASLVLTTLPSLISSEAP